MLFDILALISTLIIITLLKRLINIFPSLIACTMRWKESISLEASVKHSLDRNLMAAAMIIPFCLTAERFSLYAPEFTSGLNENARTGIIIAVFTAYVVLRAVLAKSIKPRKMNKKTYNAAICSSYTFFIILTMTLLAMGGSMEFLDIKESIITSAMLWVSGGIYCLSLLRKLQIFLSAGSFFTAFLYLCALEFLPTGALVASAIIF